MTVTQWECYTKFRRSQQCLNSRRPVGRKRRRYSQRSKENWPSAFLMNEEHACVWCCSSTADPKSPLSPPGSRQLLNESVNHQADYLYGNGFMQQQTAESGQTDGARPEKGQANIQIRHNVDFSTALTEATLTSNNRLDPLYPWVSKFSLFPWLSLSWPNCGGSTLLQYIQYNPTINVQPCSCFNITVSQYTMPNPLLHITLLYFIDPSRPGWTRTQPTDPEVLGQLRWQLIHSHNETVFLVWRGRTCLVCALNPDLTPILHLKINTNSTETLHCCAMSQMFLWLNRNKCLEVSKHCGFSLRLMVNWPVLELLIVSLNFPLCKWSFPDFREMYVWSIFYSSEILAEKNEVQESSASSAQGDLITAPEKPLNGPYVWMVLSIIVKNG